MRKSPLDAWIEEKHDFSLNNRESLEDWQMERLNQIIGYARRNSSYYKKSLCGLGDLSSLSDFFRFPFTDSGILRAQGNRMLCVSQGDISRVVTLSTSGTVDSPKRLYFTEEDQALTVDFFCHGMRTLTSPGEKVLIALPCTSDDSVGDLLARGLIQMGASPVKYGLIGNLQEAAELLHSEQPEVCVGVPVQMLGLSAYCAHHGIQSSVKRILLSTDYASESLKRQIERNWGCEIFNHYGMTEMGLGGAVECSAHSGMHIRENDLYMEVIDPATGQVLPDETEGELVITTLTRRGMPLIRYRTGDRGMLSRKRCSCGSILQRVLYVGGRIEVAGRKETGIQRLDELIFSLDGVMDYRVESWENGTFIMKVWVLGTVANDLPEKIYELSKQILPDNTEVEMIEIGTSLLRYAGKRKLNIY